MLRTALMCAVISTVAVGVPPPHPRPHADVFWLHRYGSDVSWDDQKSYLDNFAANLLDAPELVGYVVVNAGRKSCRGEALAWAGRAKRYVSRVRGIDQSRITVVDIGYREEAETQLLLAKRGEDRLSWFKHEGPKDGYVVADCGGKVKKKGMRAKP